MDALQLVQKRRIVMNVRKSIILSFFPNQWSVGYVAYHKQYKYFIMDKVTQKIIRDNDIVLVIVVMYLLYHIL